MFVIVDRVPEAFNTTPLDLSLSFAICLGILHPAYLQDS